MDEQRRKRVHLAKVRLADGDRDAFGGVCLMRCGGACGLRASSPDAEDLAQQALLKVFSRISVFDTTRDGVAWVFGIAAYEVKTLRRQVQRRREAADAPAEDDIADRAHSPEQLLLEDDLNRALSEALGELSAADRAVLLPDDGGASAEPTTDAARRKRRQRAMERLRAIWSKLYA